MIPPLSPELIRFAHKSFNQLLMNKPPALDRQVGGDHYKMPIQHVEFCQRNKIPWCESAAIKYIVRHRQKDGRQDIEKAIHYLEMLLELEYPIKPENPE